MKLSKRLETVASMVTKGNRAADVGCDHGFVPIFLVESGTSPLAVAADVRPGPLSRAKEHIKEHRLEEKIQTRLSDGLANIKPDEADSLIMSGIGGILMMRLLQDEEHTAKSFKCCHRIDGEKYDQIQKIHDWRCIIIEVPCQGFETASS